MRLRNLDQQAERIESEPLSSQEEAEILEYALGLEHIRSASRMTEEMLRQSDRLENHILLAEQKIEHSLNPKADLEKARDLFFDVNPEGVEYGALAFKLSKVSKKAGDDPFKILEHAFKQLDDSQGQAHALKDIAKAYFFFGNDERAVEIINTIPFASVQARTYAESAVCVDDEKKQELFLHSADAIAMKEESESGREDSYRDISLAHTKLGQCDKALAYAHKIKKNQLTAHDAYIPLIEYHLERGHFVEALTVAKQDRWRSGAQALRMVASALCEVGQFKQAEDVMSEHLSGSEEDINRLRARVLLAGARAEFGEQASSRLDDLYMQARKVDETYLGAPATTCVLEAMIALGDLDGARAKLEVLPFDEQGISKCALITAYAKRDEWQEAHRLLDEMKKMSRDRSSNYFNFAEASLALSQHHLNVGARLLEKNRRIEALDETEKERLLAGALAGGKAQVITALGSLVSPQTQQRICESMGGQGADAQRLLDYGRSYFLEDTGNESDIRTRARKELLSASQKIAEEGADLTLEDRYDFILICQTLLHLSSHTSKALVLDVARALSEQNKHPFFSRILDTLIEMDTSKGNDCALDILSSREFPRHLFWLFYKKLCSVGHLDESLIPYLNEARQKRAGATGESIVDLEKQDILLLQSIVTMFGINPDPLIVGIIRDNVWTSEAGELIDPVLEPEKTLLRIRDIQQEVESIVNRDEFVHTLATRPQDAALYYMIHGGETQFALINSYNSKKFIAALRFVDGLQYHDGPLGQFEDSLQTAGLEKAQIEQILEALKNGTFPVKGNGEWLVRVDVSNADLLQSVEREIKQAFGNSELGLLLKRVYYADLLKEKGDHDAVERVESADGLASLSAAIETLEREHPSLTADLESHLEKTWSAVQRKGLPPIALRDCLTREENDVSLVRLKKSLDIYRKDLQHNARKKATPQAAEEIRAIGAQSYASLLRAFLQSVCRGKGDPALTDGLFEEWQTHIDTLFIRHDDAGRQSRKHEQTARERAVRVRYLDKRADLIAALRFPDSAQCCFTSENAYVGNEVVGSGAWISKIWKDPLSFVFLLEDEEQSAGRRNAIGFVFGSFGVNEDGAPITLLNGVYLQTRKTDSAVQAILNSIEANFSRPLGCTEQYTASRHGGSAKFSSEYKNTQRSVTRLRAIADRNGKPDTQIYDDLNLSPNLKSQLTDSRVWWKKIEPDI